MSDDIPSHDDKPDRRRPIQREAFRQEKAKVFARDAITCDHVFMAFDRAAARGKRSHLYEAQRGVRADTPDTLTIAHWLSANGFRTVHIWVEWKAIGQRPSEGQFAALRRLSDLTDIAVWCRTISEYHAVLHDAGVPLVPNAAYRAMVLDGLVDSRIAKAKAKIPGARKKAATRKPEPRYTAGKRLARRIYAG